MTTPSAARFAIPALLLLAAALLAAADDKLTPLPAGEYPAKQTQEGVTIAVKPYHSDALMEQAFSKKAKPYEYGILPILVVMTNDSEDSIDLSKLSVRYVDGRREGLEPIPAEELAFFNPKGHQPRDKSKYNPIPGMNRPKVKKGPLDKPEITTSGFRAPVLAPKASASGFFFFDTGTPEDPFTGVSIYLTGMRNLNSGQDLFYFEIPLDEYR